MPSAPINALRKASSIGQSSGLPTGHPYGQGQGEMLAAMPQAPAGGWMSAIKGLLGYAPEATPAATNIASKVAGELPGEFDPSFTPVGNESMYNMGRPPIKPSSALPSNADDVVRRYLSNIK